MGKVDGRIDRMTGANNPNWNGGTSDYENHADMKRVRLIKLQQVKGRCEVCGEKAHSIHHIDGSKNNHDIDNLAVLCQKCHGTIHSGRKNKTSKYIRECGMTLKEIAEKVGACPGTVGKAFRKNGEEKEYFLRKLKVLDKFSDIV